MPAIHRLTALAVKRAKPGRHADGGQLYLQVIGASRTWLFRYERFGKETWMGCGSTNDVGLSKARELAMEYRKLLSEGLDPITIRKQKRAKAEAEAAKAIDFGTCATQFIAAHKAGWRNAKSEKEWTNTLAEYATAVFGNAPVGSIDTEMVMRALSAIWLEKPQTGSKVRQRIESVIDWATTQKYREGPNPAAWRGHLQNLLPQKSKIWKVKSYSAIPYQDMPSFMTELRARPEIAARALEYTIQTAARTGEVRGATASEIDFNAKVWVVPGERMKAGREHRVPLAPEAFTLIEHADGPLFPGLKRHDMLELIKDMGRSETVHGFRASFKTWASEVTSFPREVIEFALAHRVGNQVEQAYNRGDTLEKRRKLMAAWARYLAAPADNKVVSIR